LKFHLTLSFSQLYFLNKKFQSYVEFWNYLPENEKIIVDVLRSVILENIPQTCKEKLAYNVPFYYGNKRICLIWPASVPFGGIREGVLLGFCQGYKLEDPDQYLMHGTNKRVFYKIFKSTEEIDPLPIISLLKEAVKFDKYGRKKYP
jgi:hypothetical protein